MLGSFSVDQIIQSGPLHYHFTNRPKQHPCSTLCPHPCSALCRTPTDPPLAHKFCLHFIPVQPCHTVTNYLFFKWSLCRNRFSIAICSCLQVWRCRTTQFCSSFAGVCCTDQSLHRLSRRPEALCRPSLISSPATSRYWLSFSMPGCSPTSHGSPS